MRKFEVSNFRNLGVGEKITLNLPEDDLTILIGENNVGKSNVLAALNAFGEGKIEKDDEPNFIGNDSKPSLKLVYESIDNATPPPANKFTQRI